MLVLTIFERKSLSFNGVRREPGTRKREVHGGRANRALYQPANQRASSVKFYDFTVANPRAIIRFGSLHYLSNAKKPGRRLCEHS